MPTRSNFENARDLIKTFKELWVQAGETVETLPEVWREQVVVWESEGITELELRRFFRSWSAKPRIQTPAALWSYIQVCCFNESHPDMRPVRRSRTRRSDNWFPQRDTWSEPPWMGRDPGPDGGW